MGRRSTWWTGTLAGVAMLALSAVHADDDAKRHIEIDFHGFVSQGVLYSNENNYLNESSDLDASFNEFALNASLRPATNVMIGAQVFARDLGDLGNYEPTLDWAVVDWRPEDWLGLRVGKFKLPYGLYNETADVDSVRTWVLQPQAVYDLQFRDFLFAATGVNLYGFSRLGRGGSVDYQLFGGRIFFDDDGSLARLVTDSFDGLYRVTDIDNDYDLGFQVVWNTPVRGLRTGYTFARGVNIEFELATTPAGQAIGAPDLPPGIEEFDIWVLSVEHVVGPWSTAAEYSSWKGDFFRASVNNERYYLQLARRLNDRFEVGGYYSAFYDDKHDRDGSTAIETHRAFQRDNAATLRVDLNRFFTLKTELHVIDGAALTLKSENPGGTERNWWMLATKISFSF